MRGFYVPHQQKDWEAFFQSQSGQRGGNINGFSGMRYQRGAGIGSVFSSLFRTLLPVAKTVGKAVGRQALSTGAQVASDALAGQNLGEALKQRGREGAAQILNKGMRRLNKPKRKPKGKPKKKRRQTGHGRRRRRTKKRVQKGGGLGKRPRRAATIKGSGGRGMKRSVARRKRSDQLGSYFA